MSAMIGIASEDLWGTWQTDAELADEVRVQAMVATDADGVVNALIVCDLCLMVPNVALEMRAAVAGSIGASVEQVGIFTTQNHGVPYLDETTACFGDRSALVDRFVQAACRAHATAQTAEYAVVTAVPAEPLSIRRRHPFRDCGEFTFWSGYRTLSDGRTDAAHLLRAACAQLAAGRPVVAKYPGHLDADLCSDGRGVPDVPESWCMEGEVDPLMQGIFFRTRDGEPIGALARWSAHPATSTGLGGTTGGDYPVYVRRRLAELFGGEALFLTGPCGDLLVPVESKDLKVAKQAGDAVADHLFGALGDTPWRALDSVRAGSQVVRLPLRSDIPDDRAECCRAHDEARSVFADRHGNGASLAELKVLSDRIESLSYWAEDQMQSWTGLNFSDLQKGTCDHACFALRLGDAVVLGLPGEPVGYYSRALREQIPVRELIVVEEANGYLGYMPAAADVPQGGYEVCASPYDERVEAVVLEAMSALVRSVYPH